jgi:hypothetical protein
MNRWVIGLLAYLYNKTDQYSTNSDKIVPIIVKLCRLVPDIARVLPYRQSSVLAVPSLFPPPRARLRLEDAQDLGHNGRDRLVA